MYGQSVHVYMLYPVTNLTIATALHCTAAVLHTTLQS